jgi:hypothetical protein
VELQLAPRRGSNWSAVTMVLAVAIPAAAISLHTIERLKNVTIALVTAGQPVTPARLFSVVGPVDAVLAAVTVLAALALVYAEWRMRAVSRVLSTANPAQCFAILTIVTAWAGQAYLFPGVLLGGDTGTHIARFLEVRTGLDTGTVPHWTNYQYLGSPLLDFTGPLLYVVGGAVDVVVRDAVMTAKILLFASHLASGWLFYLLLRRLDFGATAAMVAAIGFAGSFAHLHLFIYRGVFPQAFTIVFLVLVFYAAEGLMRETRHLARDWLVFALATAGLIVNHQPHALFVGLYLALFGAASLALRRWRWSWSGLLLLGTAGAAGVAMSLFAVLPILVEADWVMIAPEGGLFGLRIPTWQRLGQLLLWRNTRTTWGIDYWAYLGIAFVGLAFFGAWAALAGRQGDKSRRLALAILPCSVLGFFLFNPVVRDVIFILFFGGVFAAFGMEQIGLAARDGSRVPMFAALAVILDVASTSVQPVARSDKQFLIDAGSHLAATAPDQRVVEIDLARDGSFIANIGPNAGPMSFYSTVQRVAGHHNMAATRVHNYAESIVKRVEHDLRGNGHLTPDTEALLGVLNATRVVCAGSFAMGCPSAFAGTIEEPLLGRVLRVADAGPAVFSRRLVELSPAPEFDKPMLWDDDFETDRARARVGAISGFLEQYLRAAGIASASRVAASLPVRSRPADLPPVSDADTPWRPKVTRYKVSLERADLTIESDGRGYVQLSHPYYPATEVLINGKHVEPLQGSLDLIVVPIDPGSSAIELRPTTTPIRSAAMAISAAGGVVAFALAGLLGFYRSRRRP